MKELTPEQIKETKIYRQWSMTDEEYELIAEKLLKRLPNFTETGLFSAMWSEHCSYKNSKPILRTFPNKGKRNQVVAGPGEGAGIVNIGDNQGVVFKTESHNHPSYVEPFQGAATGIGGIIRDIFSMGARPVASMDSLRFGKLETPRMPYLVNEVVHGISHYGNAIGIPTVGGETAFDDCYNGNILVNAFNLGIVDLDHIQQGRAYGEGNSILYVGAKTGRDGINGATFASHEFDDSAESERSAVQVGDPFMEKLLLEACLEVIENHQDILIGIQDMGAAGLVSSSSEMAAKSNTGLELDLDKVPQREKGMIPYEIMLSESQERMLLCVKKGYEEEIKDIFKKYELDAVEIGKVINETQYRLYQHGKLVADVPVHSLVDDVPEPVNSSKKPERMSRFEAQGPYQPTDLNGEDILKRLLAQPNLSSKKTLTNRYDSMVQANTVFGPGSDSALIRVRGYHKGIAMTMDVNERYVYLNPYLGGAMAVGEAYRNLIATGADPLAITDCLNYGDPSKPEIYYELVESARGITDACVMFDTPVVSGNVSLYNEHNGVAIYPTPSIGMVGIVSNLDYRLPISFQEAGDHLLLVGETRDDFSGSELQNLLTGKVEGTLRDYDLKHEFELGQLLKKVNEASLLHSAHDLSEGGLGIALT